MTTGEPMVRIPERELVRLVNERMELLKALREFLSLTGQDDPDVRTDTPLGAAGKRARAAIAKAEVSP